MLSPRGFWLIPLENLVLRSKGHCKGGHGGDPRPPLPAGRQPRLTLEVQRERDALVLQPVDQLAAVAPLVLQGHVRDGERGVVAVAVPQAHPGAEGPVVLVVQPVGDDDDALPVVGRLHLAPLHPVVAGQGAQDTGQRGGGTALRVHRAVQGLQQVLQARGGCGEPGTGSEHLHGPKHFPTALISTPSWLPAPILAQRSSAPSTVPKQRFPVPPVPVPALYPGSPWAAGRCWRLGTLPGARGS